MPGLFSFSYPLSIYRQRVTLWKPAASLFFHSFFLPFFFCWELGRKWGCYSSLVLWSVGARIAAHPCLCPSLAAAAPVEFRCADTDAARVLATGGNSNSYQYGPYESVRLSADHSHWWFCEHPFAPRRILIVWVTVVFQYWNLDWWRGEPERMLLTLGSEMVKLMRACPRRAPETNARATLKALEAFRGP